MMDGERKGGWIWLASGRRFWPRDPRIEDLTLEDIAIGAANEPRFAGQTRPGYSVAQHEVLVSYEIETRLLLVDMPEVERIDVILAGAVHDGAEGLGFRDVPAPIKHDPGNSAWMADYRAGEKACQEVVFDFAGVGQAARRHPIIKECDIVLRVTEQRDIQPPIPPEFLEEKELRPEPLPERIVPWCAERAEFEFLMRYHELVAHRDEALRRGAAA